MLSVTVEPLPSATTSCRPTVLMPGPFACQVKFRPSTTSVTSQTACGSLGWRILVLEPTSRGPASSRLTLSIVGVHSGQRATSNSTSHTRCGAASTCLVVSKALLMYQTVHLCGPVGPGRDRADYTTGCGVISSPLVGTACTTWTRWPSGSSAHATSSRPSQGSGALTGVAPTACSRAYAAAASSVHRITAAR